MSTNPLAKAYAKVFVTSARDKSIPDGFFCEFVIPFCHISIPDTPELLLELGANVFIKEP